MLIIPAWMVVAIVARDFLITGFRLLIPQNRDGIAARQSGKHKTAFQFAAIVGVLVFLVIKETSYWNPYWTNDALRFIYWSMFFIVVITLWSGIRFVMKSGVFRQSFH